MEAISRKLFRQVMQTPKLSSDSKLLLLEHLFHDGHPIAKETLANGVGFRVNQVALAEKELRRKNFTFEVDGLWQIVTGHKLLKDNPNAPESGPICSLCEGEGLIPHPDKPGETITCPACLGTGKPRGDYVEPEEEPEEEDDLPPEPVPLAAQPNEKTETCPRCNGRQLIEMPGGGTITCPRCFGMGIVRVEEKKKKKPTAELDPSNDVEETQPVDLPPTAPDLPPDEDPEPDPPPAAEAAAEPEPTEPAEPPAPLETAGKTASTGATEGKTSSTSSTGKKKTSKKKTSSKGSNKK